MNGDTCRRPGCTGTIEDGYCNVCGHAEGRAAAPDTGFTGRGTGAMAPGTASRTISTAITGSSPISRAAAAGSRRTSRSSSRTTRRQMGAGLITLPDLPPTDPERAVLLDPKVPENKRFCAKCDAPLKREAGFCGKCGTRYSFVPSLRAGDVVAGQYAVRGPIAFGGLGWIYLAFDNLLSRYVVLKGLLNTEDASAAAAAVAERQFLAAVKYPNIVGIYNFTTVGAEGFIVMEYVGGKTLKQLRQERGPLPTAEAIAYIHRILPAFGYLHRLGLVYCDFKPDNAMLEGDDIKLIDLGGVRRIDDTKGDIYGTVGYSAPEAGEGPTPASDLFTLGRTLAVLLTDIKGFSKDHRYTLPSPGENPKLASNESLYRFLLKATAEKADDRFETADDMAEQLLGVLREVVATDTGIPRPGTSVFFGGDLLALDAGDEMTPVPPDFRQLPLPALDLDDPAAQAVASASALADPGKRVGALRLAASQQPKSREARLRLASALADTGEFAEADHLFADLGREDAWDWRVQWFAARAKLAAAQAPEARRLFDQVYFDLPGELAPKLGLALAAEMSGDAEVAARLYELVARTDPGYVSAVFGLARCHARAGLGGGNRRAAVDALSLIPPSSALFTRARVESARVLTRSDGEGQAHAPAAEDLLAASTLAESLPLAGAAKSRLETEIFTAAISSASAKGGRGPLTADRGLILGKPLQEPALRLGLEAALRAMARYAPAEERIRLTDQANQVRPRTWV